MDLSGNPTGQNILKLRLGNTKGAHLVVLENPEQKEDVKLYGKLPDYGDFQGYDLWIEAVLSRIARGIYAYFHKPQWGTSKRRVFMAEIPKKLLRDPRNIAERDKKGDVKQEMMFRGIENRHCEYF